MVYKGLLLDIDGTLVCRERRHISQEVQFKLKQLQERGIHVILATGRAAFACTQEALGADVAMDYRVCANGALIVDKRNEVLYERRLSKAQVEALAEYAVRHAYQLNMTFEDRYYSYSGHKEFVAFYNKQVGSNPIFIKDGSDRTRHLESLPYGAYTTMPLSAAKEFCKQHPDIKMMQSVPNTFDVSLWDVDKEIGAEIVLRRLALSWQDVVAVGDGENDLGMIRRAGVGVAMGNAPEHVKAAADAVTDSAEQDGVLRVLSEYFSG